MTNAEIQMTKEFQMPKHESESGALSFRISSFVILSSFVIRH